jgi:lactose/L-arabinose transport system substrate-binding protein
MTKKIVALVLALCMVLGASAALAEKLTVNYWDDNFNGNALRAAAEDYKTNVDPDFELELVLVSGSSDVENSMTTAGSSGDYSNLTDIVLFQDHYIQRYVADYPAAWLDLEDAGINWDDFGAEKLSYSTVGGKHYGVPVDNGTAIMAYRTDILEECGYKIEDMKGITWEKFLEIGKEVYAKTGKALLSMDGSGNDLPYMMMQAEGESQFKDGKAFIAGNEKLTRIISIICDMVKENVLILANDWTGYTNETIMQDQVAGVFNGNWIIPTMSQVTDNTGKWQITTIPTLDGGDGYAANGGSSLYVTANCQNPELAKKFLAYTFGGSTKTYDEALLKGGVIGCCLSAAQSDVYKEGVPFFNGQAVYSDIVEMGSHVPIVEQNDFHYTVRTSIGNAIQNILGGQDVESALQAAQEEIDFAMDQ